MREVNLLDNTDEQRRSFNNYISEPVEDRGRVGILKKLLQNFDKQCEFFIDDTNEKLTSLSPELKLYSTKIFNGVTPKKPKIVSVKFKEDLNIASSNTSLNSYWSVVLNSNNDENNMTSTYENSEYYSAYEDLDFSTISPESKSEELGNFVRNSRISQSYRSYRTSNVSNEKNNFYKRNSLRSIKRELENKFVVNLYESRVTENKIVTNDKMSKEALYATPIKKNKTKLHICNDEKANNLLPSEGEQYCQKSNIKKEYEKLNLSTSTDSGFSECNNEIEEKKSPADIFDELKQQADIQGHIMKQASQLLETIRKQKHNNAPEKILAEKILLKAGYTHEALLQEIRQNQYENMSPSSNHHSASLSVSGLSFNLKNNVIDDNHHYYFTCICSKGSKVHETETIEARPGQKAITFQNTFDFDDLDINFTLNVNVYMLKIKKNRNKFGFSRVKSCYNTPRKVLYKDTYSYDVIETQVSSPSFVRCANLQVRISDLKKEVWNLETDADSPLSGITALKLKITKLNIKTNYRGFVTVGKYSKNNSMSWNRMWCKLKGTKLKFWNYPSDEYINPPCKVMDLRKILSKNVDFAQRDVCPRPKTLYLVTDDEECSSNFENNHQSNYCKMTEWFLSTDYQSEADEWKRHLNANMEYLKQWNTNEETTYL